MPAAILSGELKKQGRFPVLDALRCVFALWVAVGHLGIFPLFAGVDTATRLGHLLTKGWATVVFGTPAVIGFFIISGFCIHLPFSGGEQLSVGRYYARRYTRILVPVVAALAFSRAIGIHQPIFGPGSMLWNNVLWSLACEEMYYAVYPAARLLKNRFGWNWLLAPAFLVSVLAIFLDPRPLNGTILGVSKTALILFPVWLLGALLAEQSRRLVPEESARIIWIWRLSAWLLSWVCEMVYFHAGVPLDLTMLVYGTFAFFWIRKELALEQDGRVFRTLAWAGAWSYSLYLMHQPLGMLVSKLPIPNLGIIVNWFLLYLLVLPMAYIFYLCVERPSHRLARRIHLHPGSKKPAASLLGAESHPPRGLADGLAHP